jgi:hypothetical protein
VPFGIRASATIAQTVVRKRSPNVIGTVLKGQDSLTSRPLHGATTITSVSARPGPDDPPGADRIFNGAVDNASGVAGVLSIAQALARAGAPPGHSLYVMFTTAEESGLLGAEYLRASAGPCRRAVAREHQRRQPELAGRTHDLALSGCRAFHPGAGGRRTMAASHGRVIGPDPEPGRGYFYRSDHFPLAKIGVPALSLADPREYVGVIRDYAKRIRDSYNDTDYHQPRTSTGRTWDMSGAIEDMKFLAQLGG